MAIKLEIVSDFICPFCYIGFETVRKLRPEFRFDLEWRGYQIHPEWPAEGLTSSQYLSAIDPGRRRAIWTHIESMAEAAGFTMKQPEVLTNSRLALEAAEFATDKGKGEAFEERVYRAYFGEGLNIGLQGVLGDLAADVGLDRGELNHALETKHYTGRLDSHALAARQRGVEGVPTFFLGKYSLVGSQSMDIMRDFLRRNIET